MHVYMVLYMVSAVCACNIYILYVYVWLSIHVIGFLLYGRDFA
jgi:hypothetical protein